MVVFACLAISICSVLLSLLFNFDWERYEQARNGNLPSDLSKLDRWRNEMKMDGMVVHMPSYREGIEAYVRPAEQYANVSPSWPKKFQ